MQPPMQRFREKKTPVSFCHGDFLLRGTRDPLRAPLMWSSADSAGMGRTHTFQALWSEGDMFSKCRKHIKDSTNRAEV